MNMFLPMWVHHSSLLYTRINPYIPSPKAEKGASHQDAVIYDLLFGYFMSFDAVRLENGRKEYKKGVRHDA